MPTIEVLLTEDAPSPLNPLGLKGAGEGGINAVGAVIAAAIDDAHRHAGRGDAAAGDAAADAGAAGRKSAIARNPVPPTLLSSRDGRFCIDPTEFS